MAVGHSAERRGVAWKPELCVRDGAADREVRGEFVIEADHDFVVIAVEIAVDLVGGASSGRRIRGVDAAREEGRAADFARVHQTVAVGVVPGVRDVGEGQRVVVTLP